MNGDRRGAAPERDFQSARDRIYSGATASRDGRKALVSVLLAVAVFLLILSLSVRQTTDPVPAQRLIEAGIAVTTDVDTVIAENFDALRELARTSNAQVFAIPGYPLDVFVTREELLSQSPAHLRDLVLSRSSAVIYTQGLRAFDRSGNQSLSRFSWQGLIELGVSQLSASTNDRAGAASLAFALLAAAAACALLAVNAGWERVRALGLATLIGALPGVLLFALAWFGAGTVGGGDPYVEDLRDIVRTILTVPLRNYAAVVVLGAALTTSGILLPQIAVRTGGAAALRGAPLGNLDEEPGAESPRKRGV